MKNTNENMVFQDLSHDYAYLVKNDVKKLILIPRKTQLRS